MHGIPVDSGDPASVTFEGCTLDPGDFPVPAPPVPYLVRRPLLSRVPTRLRLVWNALLGRPIAWRLTIQGGLAVNGRNGLIADCLFRSSGTWPVNSPAAAADPGEGR